MDYIDRIRRVVTAMLDERDEDGAPVWVRPQPYDHSDYARRYHDELCYRLRMSGENATQIRLELEDNDGIS